MIVHTLTLCNATNGTPDLDVRIVTFDDGSTVTDLKSDR